MIYKNIPNTDLRVSSLCMGGGALCVENAKDNAFNLLDKYVELDGNFIDTANIYGKWLSEGRNISEYYIGLWMKEHGNRDKIILATKGGHPHLSSMLVPRLSKEEVTKDLDESLQTLGTDYVDLYWLHRNDDNLPVAYILEYLNEFVKNGKIRYFGCSNWKAERIEEAIEYADKTGIKGFVGNQMMWSFAAPNQEAISDPTLVTMNDETYKFHKRTGLAAIPYSSQANGFFDKLEEQGIENIREGLRKKYYNEENIRRFEKIKKISKEQCRSVTEISLGYLISQSFTTIPIVGCRTIEQMVSSMKAGEDLLNAETMRYLEEV